MDIIKLDWIPTKIRRVDKKIPPTLLLVLATGAYFKFWEGSTSPKKL